jgi:hypothetical protein
VQGEVGQVERLSFGSDVRIHWWVVDLSYGICQVTWSHREDAQMKLHLAFHILSS